ncbi:MAG: pimeloyl-ACP methyl ester carboxylesterase [Candidatus Promineifilaceae bacterium]
MREGRAIPAVTTNGIEVYYEEQGSGTPLLLIMGITATGAVWEKHAEFWQQSFRCIMPDNRGVGLSEKPEGPYSSAMMADDHAGLLQELGIESAHVVGVSMGSIIAQQLALRHPQCVNSLVLMCPWARCDAYAKSIFNHMEVAKARLTPAEFMEFIQLLIFAKPSWDDADTYQSLLDGRSEAALAPIQQPLHGLIGQSAACKDHDVLADLPKIASPTLVIGGEDDIFTPSWMAKEVAEAVPGAELHLYPFAGHAFHWEHLEEFNTRVHDWIRERA